MNDVQISSFDYSSQRDLLLSSGKLITSNDLVNTHKSYVIVTEELY